GPRLGTARSRRRGRERAAELSRLSGARRRRRYSGWERTEEVAMAWQYCALVVANVTGSSPELIQALKDRAAQGDCRFTLIVPATGGGSAGRDDARRRLGRALEVMREESLKVEGQIGDPDPVAAVTDVWDPTKFDEVIVSTLPTGTS